MLDFRMDTFLAVCQYMNYTRAAEALNITQPAVSQHIRWLEEQYEAPLFTYANKRLSLTREGELLRSMALTVKHDEQMLRRRLHDPGPGAHRLVFGVTPTVGMSLIPEPLARYHRLYPDAPISMRVSNTERLCAALDQGELDFAIVEGYFCKSDYDSLLYRREPYLAVCGAEYQFEREPEGALRSAGGDFGGAGAGFRQPGDHPPGAESGEPVGGGFSQCHSGQLT